MSLEREEFSGTSVNIGMTLLEQIHRQLHDSSNGSDDSSHHAGFNGAFWAVNGLVVVLMVMVCGWVCCCGGLSRLIELTQGTAVSSDMIYQQRLRERIERQEASKRMTPEQRKRKILESFQRNQVKMIVNASDIVVEEDAETPSPKTEEEQQPTDNNSSAEDDQQGVDVDVEQGAPSTDTAIASADAMAQENVDDDYEEEHMLNNGYLILRHASLAEGQQPRKVPNCCAICLMNYEQDDSVVWSINPDCPHVFHEDCLLGWLVHSSQHDSTPCPCCRQSFTDLQTFRRERTIRWDPENAFNPRAVTF